MQRRRARRPRARTSLVESASIRVRVHGLRLQPKIEQSPASSRSPPTSSSFLKRLGKDAARRSATSPRASSRSTPTRSSPRTWPGSGRGTRIVLTGRPRRGYLVSAGGPKETVETVSAPDDSRDIASMSREQRDALKRELLAAHPELAKPFRVVT